MALSEATLSGILRFAGKTLRSPGGSGHIPSLSADLGGYRRNRARSLGIQRGSQVMMVAVAAKLPIVTKKAPG